MRYIRFSKKFYFDLKNGIRIVSEKGDYGITFDSLGFNIHKGFYTSCYYWFWVR